MIHTVKIEVDLESLVEVINNSNNPSVAIKLLNGTYQEPLVYQGDTASPPDKDGKVKKYTFIGYDKWKNEVLFTHEGRWSSDSMTVKAWNSLVTWEQHEYNICGPSEIDVWDGDETDKIVY